jgi:hypothetical protein
VSPEPVAILPIAAILPASAREKRKKPIFEN